MKAGADVNSLNTHGDTQLWTAIAKSYESVNEAASYGFTKRHSYGYENMVSDYDRENIIRILASLSSTATIQNALYELNKKLDELQWRPESDRRKAHTLKIKNILTKFLAK